MLKLDDDLLTELGLAALAPEEKKKFLAHIYETLEIRVGMQLAEKMADDQLAQFEQFMGRHDEAGALKWLAGNFPDYKDIVSKELRLLKDEIRRIVPHILASGTNQAPPVTQSPQPAWQPVHRTLPPIPPAPWVVVPPPTTPPSPVAQPYPGPPPTQQTMAGGGMPPFGF